MNIEQVTWNPGHFGATLEAEINGHTVELWVELTEGQIHPTIVVDKKYLSSRTNDWTAIEKVFPREYWPIEIYRGRAFNGKKSREPRAFRDAINSFNV